MKAKPLTTLIRILISAVLVLLPVFLICMYIRLFPMNYADGEAPYYFWNRDVSRSSSDRRYRVLILGDSAANAAYLPEVLSEDTINLSLGGTTPVENYYVLSDWLNAHEAPETVFLSFMDYHMIYDNMFYERTVYAHRLTPSQEREVLSEARDCQDENIAIKDAEEQLFQYDHYLPQKYLPALLNAGFSSRRAENEAHYAAVSLHRGAYIGLSDAVYMDTDPNVYDSYVVNPLYDRYYRKILALCQEKGIQARIISLPKTGNSVLTERFHNQRDGYYEALAEEYPCAQYDARIETMDNRCFLDWEHFNTSGAWLFSSRLRRMYPDVFHEEVPSDETLIGQLEYLKLIPQPDQLLNCLNNDYFSALLITQDSRLALLSGAEDTGIRLGSKTIWLKSRVIEKVLYNENDGRDTSVSFVINEDGSQAVRLGENWLPVTVDDYAGATVILLSHRNSAAAEVRNYLKDGTGYVLKK